MTDTTTTSPRSGDEERAKTIALRQGREKQAVIEQLKKIPIVQHACEKVSVSRATYYNWKRDDEEFAKQADEAISDGTGFVNDMAESQLLSAIKDGNLGAITYWLKHRHTAYSNKVELTANIKQQTTTLNPAQEAAVEEALRLAALQLPSISDISSPHSNEPNSESIPATSTRSPSSTDVREPAVLSDNLSQPLPDGTDTALSSGNDGTSPRGEN